MLLRTCFAVSVLCAAGLTPIYAGKPAPCQDIPIQWTVASTTGIIADNSGAYVNGKLGVSASIKICDGTHDAVLMTGSSRNLTFDFSQHILGSNTPPTWAVGFVTGSGGVLNVRNITFMRDTAMATEYGFTTWMGSDVPVKGSWNFRMWNPNTSAVSGDPGTNPYLAAANTPFTDTLVDAYHCPARTSADAAAATGLCHNVTLETWFVWPDGAGPWIGGLENTGKPTSPLNAGEFSMPFYFVISVL